MRRDLAELASDHPLLTDDGTRLREAAERLLTVTRVRFDLLWNYYKNPTRPDADPTDIGHRPYRQAQEWGLPPRITGRLSGDGVFDATPLPGTTRKEVVIENDIGWRIETQVDFLFGRPIVVNSASPDAERRPIIEQLLRQTLANNGGLVFLQKLALLGAVYGQVDVLVKFVPEDSGVAPDDACPTQFLGATAPAPAAEEIMSPLQPHAGPATEAEASPADAPVGNPEPNSAANNSPWTIDRLARVIRFEIVDPTRALPLLEPGDCTCVDAFAVVYQLPRVAPPPTPVRQGRWWLSRLSRKQLPDPDKRTIIELHTASAWQKYDDGILADSCACTLGRLPLIHIQNTADPQSYDGQSDVEPLIPLQDELNTRLSDRAYRIAMTSFKMYLGKGIENFNDMPVAPGRMWSTDNAQADVIEFGGDSGGNPSEAEHIAEVREALDKLSGVSPVASGNLRGKIGNLTSAEALRVTMMSLLARTERKRTTYGTAITQLCELALAWLDHAGLFQTTAADRAVQIHWPNPVPSNEGERLALAKAKLDVGVSTDVVLRELGYGTDDASVPSPGTPGEG